MVRVLFVCVENASRSQMAEAFARVHGKGVLDPASAGSRPAGKLNPRAIAAMRERGYDLASHASKHLDQVGAGPWDFAITMGCGDECPWIEAAHREDWPIPDPRDLSPAEFAGVRDAIERRVLDLVARVRAGSFRREVP
jgi:protein-tyrosine-phosphatase